MIYQKLKTIRNLVDDLQEITVSAENDMLAAIQDIELTAYLSDEIGGSYKYHFVKEMDGDPAELNNFANLVAETALEYDCEVPPEKMGSIAAKVYEKLHITCPIRRASAFHEVLLQAVDSYTESV